LIFLSQIWAVLSTFWAILSTFRAILSFFWAKTAILAAVVRCFQTNRQLKLQNFLQNKKH
jgi:hypothetical protein